MLQLYQILNPQNFTSKRIKLQFFNRFLLYLMTVLEMGLMVSREIVFIYEKLQQVVTINMQML